VTSSTQGGQDGGLALSAERVIAAPAQAIFDAFVALYADRPAWVTSSDLDLRPGGHWSVTFAVPGGPEFREERTLTVLEPPGRIAYDAEHIYADSPSFTTSVDVTIDEVPGGHRIRLVQEGFPTQRARDDFAGAWPDVLAELDRRVHLAGGEASSR
jgi:uncharacterized protein YndB with AHSA1/START domain